MPSFLYDREQIADWLGSHIVARAAGYAHAVSNVHWADETLAGKVQGTERRPYSVQCHFHEDEQELWVESRCSCPVGIDCKHVAALLIAGLHQPPTVESVPRPELVQWLEGFRMRRLGARGATKKSSAKPTHTLVYQIGDNYARAAEVHLYKSRLSRDGLPRTLDEPWNNVEAALVKPPKFIAEDDLPILRGLWLGRTREDYGGFVLRGRTGAAILEKILATQRAVATPPTASGYSASSVSLNLGEPRAGHLHWQTQPDHRLRPQLCTDPSSTVLHSTDPPWYLDFTSHEAGALQIPWPTEHLEDFLSMPSIAPSDAALVGAVMLDVVPDMPLPPEHQISAVRVIETEPLPVLTLHTQRTYGSGWSPTGPNALDFATVTFDYGGLGVDAASSTTLRRSGGGEVVQIRRRHDSERVRLKELREAGLTKLSTGRFSGPEPFPVSMLGLDEPAQWLSFMAETIPALALSGWRVLMTDAFRYNVTEIDAIEGDVRLGGDGWFDLEMGIIVGARTVRIEPLLADLFRRDRRWLSALEGIDDAESIEMQTDRGERLRLRADRLKPVVRVLVDLFDSPKLEPLRIRASDLGRIAALENTARWRFHGDVCIRELALRLRDSAGVVPVPVPRGLRTVLRDYQREGLNWLQYLREQNLAGVLADDMGLGKTVQALAHLLVEQESGRLVYPALIVVPTTLVHNWLEEAGRFAPSLRVLNLHGSQRKDQFALIREHDLVLTTYALLWRDQEVFAKHDFHLLLLDEAQYVKNANTKAAQALRDLRARHRLCLTGTPLENHLGELWSQFDFLLPGFLGTQKDFTKRFRTPIEKGGDTVRRDLLARRIRPFMLRRTKNEVAKELPPKTLITRMVDLEGAQRDLYETVRVAVQEKVRAAVQAQGLARSHLIVLDALLKLRQVCCDPRLVKLERAAGVTQSAKLDLLLEMMAELIEEGRRILIFSQFTGMLSLIEAALKKTGIEYATLTGDTKDRVTPVKRFSKGEVPVFLISLKAGGVGLNLTAADTVIHYDPWWNPAAENQATDRAHRLGQDKPVFVYKLIAAGSIEEKIVALQEKKAALAEAILSADGAQAVKFSSDDLEGLLAPMPNVSQARRPASTD
ncbi:MAG: DEAD/DEAH box helicase [Steroidobacteraceae bacterium]